MSHIVSPGMCLHGLVVTKGKASLHVKAEVRERRWDEQREKIIPCVYSIVAEI